MGLLRRNSLNIPFGKWLSPGATSGTQPTTPQPAGGGGVGGTGRTNFGSSVAIQKLRESKWFDAGEERIFCAVIENGFIVEVRHSETGDNWFGVVTIELKKSIPKPTAENVKIYSVRMKGNEKKPMKVYCVTLTHLWQQGYQLRINNIADRTKKAHPEQDILAQIKYASKCQMVFHNSQHFCEFCRYGDRPQDSRKRQISDCAKWGGVNIGATLIFMEMQKKSKSASH